MEAFFQALGVIGLIILLVIGVLAGVIASAVEGGGNKARNIALRNSFSVAADGGKFPLFPKVDPIRYRLC